MQRYVQLNVALPETLAQDLRDMGEIFETPVSAILEQAAAEWLRRQFAEDVLRIFRAETDEEAERFLRETTTTPCPDVGAPARPHGIPVEILDRLNTLTGSQLLQVACYATDVALATGRKR